MKMASALRLPVLLSLALAACRSAEEVPLLPTFSASLDDWLERHPLGPEEAFRSDELHRGAGASLHVAQVRGGIAPHYHRDRDETVVGLRGEARMVVAGETIRVRPGVVVHVPRRMVHEARVVSSRPCAVFSLFTPPFDGSDRIFVEGAASVQPEAAFSETRTSRAAPTATSSAPR